MRVTDEMLDAAWDALLASDAHPHEFPSQEQVRVAIEAALAAAPHGEYVMVPREPTEAMKRAAVVYANGNAVYRNVAAEALTIEEGIYGEVYEAMIAAAPPAPAAQPSAEPTTECTTCGATVVRVTGVYDYPPPGDELVQAARTVVAEWREPNVLRAMDDAIDALRLALDAGEAKGGGR